MTDFNGNDGGILANIPDEILFVTHILVLIVLIFALLNYTLENQFQALTMSVSANVTLTLALIGIYRKMSSAMEEQVDEMEDQSKLQKDILDIQDEQGKIMRQQQTLLELEQQPHIEVGDYKLGKESIDVSLSNYGGGLAKDLELLTAVYFEE